MSRDFCCAHAKAAEPLPLADPEIPLMHGIVTQYKWETGIAASLHERLRAVKLSNRGIART